MNKNLGAFERLVRLALAAFALFAAAVLFVHPVARILAVAFGLYSLWEGVAAKCPLHGRLGVLAPGGAMDPASRMQLGLAAVQATVAYEWCSASREKLMNPDFVGGMGKTLANFASKNPYAWYKAFLEGPAATNSAAFGLAVEWSQMLIGLTLFATAAWFLYSRAKADKRALAVASIALAGGMLMNANFYLAAGWTSAGTRGSNIVMFWVQASLLYTWLATWAARPAAKDGAPKA